MKRGQTDGEKKVRWMERCRRREAGTSHNFIGYSRRVVALKVKLEMFVSGSLKCQL